MTHALTEDALDRIAGRELPEATRSWAAEDCMRYALAVGAGHPDPVAELHLTTENTIGQPLKPLTTFGIVLAADTDALLKVLGVSGGDVLLLSDLIEVHQPLPATGTLHAKSRIVAVAEHRRGSVVEVVTDASLDGGPANHSRAPLFRTTSRTLIRDTSDGTGAHRSPARARVADPRNDLILTERMDVAPNQALLYRLCGGRNPLHSDPAVFRAVGYERPLLQGRCSLGFVARSLTRTLCDGDPTRLTVLGARMTGPVWAGETLRLEAWGTPESGEFRVLREDNREIVLDTGVFTCRR